MNGKDKRLHGSFGDSVIERKEEADVEEQQAGGGEGKQEKTAKGFKPNALLYLKKIKEPGFAAELKRKGCSGWPCHAGFLCDFCMLRPEWIAESKLEPLNEEIAELKQSIIILRKQQQDVETLERAERLVAGKYWSKSDEERKMTLNSMLEDSTARVEAQEATRAKIAAEKVRDSLLDQLSRVQEKVKLQEKDNTSLKQQVMALQQTLEESRRKLNFVEKDLEDKRSMISEAFKEKSRATTEARRLKLEVEATNMEIAVKNEQEDEAASSSSSS
ncbi:hypothetical protein GUITHDRAFT_150441 [Guillardia theta CCMP2712]|uniref:Uncharacterized protein n=1 Tax=Guillardia theta (strain CCMP2712) TaxID=905079 RepID=L1JW66_GUITC|nr:hypothetical protein GUITHDRAFT_150441 [Guillardia theta CCMP2712]EKX52801.1 hypothetical protein GUITHDRAFT_150441 [Guillardia theta CCMP2712]|eukprot:XP_005839781.1 hypothetical protein GUITHDRAFT_150441 [Guillardia theta CCMP2712]